MTEVNKEIVEVLDTAYAIQPEIALCVLIALANETKTVSGVKNEVEQKAKVDRQALRRNNREELTDQILKKLNNLGIIMTFGNLIICKVSQSDLKEYLGIK